MINQTSIPDQAIAPLLSAAVNNVLETMFFTAPLGPGEAETAAPVLQARLSFHGGLGGTLCVCVSEASARLLAADFLGEDQEMLTDSAPGQIVCELANMVCGTLVSKLEDQESFALDPPELILAGSDNAGCPEALPTVRRKFELEHGILTVTLHLKTYA